MFIWHGADVIARRSLGANEHGICHRRGLTVQPVTPIPDLRSDLDQPPIGSPSNRPPFQGFNFFLLTFLWAFQSRSICVFICVCPYNLNFHLLIASFLYMNVFAFSLCLVCLFVHLFDRLFVLIILLILLNQNLTLPPFCFWNNRRIRLLISTFWICFMLITSLAMHKWWLHYWVPNLNSLAEHNLWFLSGLSTF